MLKILHTVQHYHPFVGGSEEVVKQISERLVKRGHDVTVATAIDARRSGLVINGVIVREFIIAGNVVNGIQGGPSEAQRFTEFVLNGDFDVMLNYAAQIWSADLIFPHLSEIGFAKVLSPCGYSGLFDPRYKHYFSDVAGRLGEYDRVVYHSDHYRDKEFGDLNGIENFTIIPNGAAEEEFDRRPLVDFKRKYRIAGKHLIICVSNHYFDKGHALVLEAFDRAQIDDAALAIIGNEPAGGCQDSCRKTADAINQRWGGRKSVHIVSNVPRTDVVDAYHQADLFIFGSRIECFPLVLIEAMASKTPFVSTDCGCAKHLPGGVVIDSQPSTNPLIARVESKLGAREKYAADPETFARKITELVGKEDKRKELAGEGHDAWRKRYCWERVVDQYENLYIELVNEKMNTLQEVAK